MGASNTDTFDVFLKEYYNQGKVKDLIESDRPLLKLLPKSTELTGESLTVPIAIKNPQGISRVHGTAYKNQTSFGGEKFVAEPGELYGFVSIGERVMRQSRNNPGAFLENRVKEIDGLYTSFSDEIATALYRGNGGLPIGTIDTGGISTVTVTLADQSDIINFEIGMSVVSVTAPSTVNDAFTVVGVDIEAGTIELNATVAGEWTAADVLYREGNYKASGYNILYGLNEFLPFGTPATLYGLDRTVHRSRLAGVVKDPSGGSTVERIRSLITDMCGIHKGPGPDLVIMNPQDWDAAANSLDGATNSRLNFDHKDKTRDFGALHFNVVAGGRVVKVISDRFCPVGNAYALKTDTWKLWSMGPLLDVVNGDGMKMLRTAATDSSTGNDYEFRLVSYPIFITDAPGWNGRTDLT